MLKNNFYLLILTITLGGCLSKESSKSANSTTIPNPVHQDNTLLINGVQTPRYQPALTTTWSGKEVFTTDKDFSALLNESNTKTVAPVTTANSNVTTKPSKVIQQPNQHSLSFKKQETKTIEIEFLGTK